MNILSRFKTVKLFVFDMDGVLTDGGLLVDEEGKWLRRMDIKDGYALQLAVKCDYKVIVISGSSSVPVAERLNKLGISEVFMKINDKEAFFEEYILKNKFLTDEILYMGDDIPDYNCMRIAGLACCPVDAVPEIKQISSYISHMRGGYGCVRDVIEKVLKLNNKWPIDTSVAST